ncbi:hypothetical protein FRX31_015512 [Thalictrum thalictroides]|uniref:Uncharacterized protein n=1 Tax=Thalictrum thalictroides TaxID=46969 RepID=A0A7J6WBV1_THATH|nr:hypothetical protein FRX31_015512 [Thalictrum thalictroides]
MISFVMSEIVKARIKPGKLKYQIGGNEFQFKPLDVTLTLGLKIGRIPHEFLFMEKGVPTAFREKYFDKKNITENKILKAIKLAREDPTSKDDIHRLNRILLLATCLILDPSLTIDVWDKKLKALEMSWRKRLT